MGKTAKRQSFLHGATILVVATALVKVIGALFRIPLVRIIGGTGMGYYSAAYDLYLPIYSLAMAGLPIAVSRLVSQTVVLGRYRDVRAYRRISQRLFLISGLVGMFIIFLIALPYVTFANSPDALLSVLMTAPSLLFCCVMSSYRGYYEGLRNMYPTAFSSIIEALGKLVLGLVGAYAVIEVGLAEFAKSGTVFGKTVIPAEDATLEQIAKLMTLPYAAAAAIAGVTVGTALGAFYLVFKHRRTGDGITREMLINSPPVKSRKYYLKTLVMISIPIVIGSLAQNIAGLVDVTQVLRQLSFVVEKNTDVIMGIYGTRLDPGTKVSEIPNFLYGCYKGTAYSIYNLVPTITSVLGVSALPALSTAWTQRDAKAVRSNLETVVRICSLFVLPAGLGVSVLSGPILGLLYDNKPNEVSIAAPILTILGFTAIFAGLTMPITNMLQAIGKQKIPVRNMFIGVFLKVIVNFILVGIPTINIVGAPVGTLVCYFFLFVTNFYCLCKHSRVKPDFISILIKPLIAAVLCAAAAWASFGPLSKLLGDERQKIATVGAIFCAMIIYLVALSLLRAIRKEDILTLPKGDKIAAALSKWHIIG